MCTSMPETWSPQLSQAKSGGTRTENHRQATHDGIGQLQTRGHEKGQTSRVLDPYTYMVPGMIEFNPKSVRSVVNKLGMTVDVTVESRRERVSWQLQPHFFLHTLAPGPRNFALRLLDSGGLSTGWFGGSSCPSSPGPSLLTTARLHTWYLQHPSLNGDLIP